LRGNPSFLGSCATRKRYGDGQYDGKVLKKHDVNPGSHFVMTRLVPAIHGLKKQGVSAGQGQA
jgi:hypothetical protein